MKLWRIAQDERNGYDTYDSAVVAAETEEEARGIHPEDGWLNGRDNWRTGDSAWATSPAQVTAEYLGEAKPGTEHSVILASFNAG